MVRKRDGIVQNVEVIGPSDDMPFSEHIRRVLSLVAYAVAAVAVLLTGSRGGLLTLIVATAGAVVGCQGREPGGVAITWNWPRS